MRVFPLVVASMFALCAGPVHAAPTLSVDPAHTSAAFSVRHLTLTTVSGTIPLKSASIVLGEGTTLAEAQATFDLTKIDTHVSDRDADLRSGHWFDVEKNPDMVFKSTKISTNPDGSMQVMGDLSFHGVTKPVTLAAKYEGAVKDAKGRHLGYSATGTLDRTQWNLGTTYPSVVVGNEIAITIQLEAIEAEASPAVR